MNDQSGKKYYIYRQLPSHQFIGHCKIALNERGDAFAMADDMATIDRLRGARVLWMAADGILITGFEETGEFAEDGRQILKYQEWFCRYYET